MKILEKLIKENNWYKISRYEYLTEEFIEKHSDKLDWFYISSYQKLSEKFIEKYSDKVNWICISECQKLSKDFIKKYSDKFSLNYLSHDIIFDENEKYNICIKCDTYYLSYDNCDELIMDQALK